MKAIATALNNIAIAITNLGKNLSPIKQEIKTNTPVSNTITSNPGNPNVKITSIYQNKNYKMSHIPYDEKVAIDAIYDALTDKGKHPDHHDYIMRELSNNWPVLYNALKKLIVARKESYNYTSSDIWRTKN
jgi:hypothetical protein